MKRSLGVVDLTSMGIAAIIGGGIFSTIGNSAAYGGPAISLLFLFTAVACGFSAMCYARFASVIPVSGSAYTYAYVAFGELIAWIIGWTLIMEYSVGNIAIAISWSDYFTGLLGGLGVDFPLWLSSGYHSAIQGFYDAEKLLAGGTDFAAMPDYLQQAWTTWTTAPQIAGIHIVADLPAFFIVMIITALVYIGIYETKMAGNIMVLLKVVILLVIIAVGAFYINPDNWSPFAPNGVGGVMKGVAGVFFAYIGFDAISTTAEECKNPKRDLPRSMIYSLVITTVLYIVISLVLTGLVSSSELAVGDPLAYAFDKLGLTAFSGVIAVSAVIAMASVLLVFQLGQPRIWMSMSRDGLLPKKFGKIHPRFKTPAFATIITGIIVGVPAIFTDLTEMADLTSIGTLFAFVLVSGGVIYLDSKKKESDYPNSFKIPYVNSAWAIPLLWIIIPVLTWYLNSDGVIAFFTLESDMDTNGLFAVFLPIAVVISFFAVKKKWSLIPVLGLLTNLYLLSELGYLNWMRFIIWLAIGLVIYFLFGYKHSLLRKNHGIQDKDIV
jgi:amino acid transporter